MPDSLDIAIGDAASASQTSETTLAASSEPPRYESPLCAAPGCSHPVPTGGGRPGRFCSTACRMRAHRKEQAKGATKPRSEDRQPSRDEAVMRLSHIMKTDEGLRLVAGSFVRVLDDERAALAATPLWWRRELAAKLVGALGLRLAPDDTA